MKPTSSEDVPPGVLLRLKLLRAKPEEFGIHQPGAVWAVAMDIGLSEGAATVVAISDGNASLYTTGSFGIVGGVGHDRVRDVAIRVCVLAEALVDQTVPAGEFPLPEQGRIRFYLLTPRGARSAEADEDELGSGKHPMSELFAAAHRLISELRRATEGASAEVLGAAASDDDATLKRLLEAGASASEPGPDGVLPIVVAASQGAARAVKLLLESGASPNTYSRTDPEGPVAVFASANGSLATLRVLADAGANLELADSTGITPLMAAAHMGHVSIVNYLLERGVSVDQRDGEGYSALMFASNAGFVDCASALIAAHADVNAGDNSKSTPLMFAAQHGHDEIVSLLLRNHARRELVGAHGLTAEGFALQNGHETTLRLLQRAR